MKELGERLKMALKFFTDDLLHYCRISIVLEFHNFISDRTFLQNEEMCLLDSLLTS